MALDAAISDHRIDAVMHLAALANVGESALTPSRYCNVNVYGTRVLLDVMIRAGIHSIVFSHRIFVKLCHLWRAEWHAYRREHALIPSTI